MSASILTAKEIFDRLGELQKQLADNKTMGQDLCAAIEAACIPDDIDEDTLKDIIESICEPFKAIPHNSTHAS